MKILDLFFPQNSKCMFCNDETSFIGICDNCMKDLPFINGQTCKICGGRLIGDGLVCIECKNRHFKFKKCYCVFEYRDSVQTKLLEFKNGDRKYLGYSFSEILANKYRDIDEKFDLIIPIPINEKRLKTRGFNQSEILCRALTDTGKVNIDILERVKDTPHQTGLDREHRISNLNDAFVVKDKSIVKGKTILLVDDIYTTGSTLNECAKTLLKAGASNVIGLCLARTPISHDKIIS